MLKETEPGNEGEIFPFQLTQPKALKPESRTKLVYVDYLRNLTPTYNVISR